MIEKAINRILELGKPNIIEYEGRPFSDKKLCRVHTIPTAEPLEMSTLSSLISYIKGGGSDIIGTSFIVHVVSPTEVRLVSFLNDDRERETLAIVRANVPDFSFGRMINHEEFIIGVQAKFVDDESTDKALVLKFAGTVKNGSVTEYGDDGVTQKATVKKGISSMAEAIVPSPCLLRPYKTFTEVEQPASEFVFRMRDGDPISCALFEADGGAWKNQAMQNISDYLKKQLFSSLFDDDASSPFIQVIS